MGLSIICLTIGTIANTLSIVLILQMLKNKK